MTSGRSRCTKCQTVLADRRIISTSVEVHWRYQNDSHIPRCSIGKTYWHDNSHTKYAKAWTILASAWLERLRCVALTRLSMELRSIFGGALVLSCWDQGMRENSFPAFADLSCFPFQWVCKSPIQVCISKHCGGYTKAGYSLYRPSFARMFTLVSHFLLPRLLFFFFERSRKFVFEFSVDVSLSASQGEARAIWVGWHPHLRQLFSLALRGCFWCGVRTPSEDKCNMFCWHVKMLLWRERQHEPVMQGTVHPGTPKRIRFWSATETRVCVCSIGWFAASTPWAAWQETCSCRRCSSCTTTTLSHSSICQRTRQHWLAHQRLFWWRRGVMCLACRDGIRLSRSTAVYAGDHLRRDSPRNSSDDKEEARDRDPDPDVEDRQDCLRVMGNYTYRNRVAPRTTRYVPSMHVLHETTVHGYWNIDGDKALSEPRTWKHLARRIVNTVEKTLSKKPEVNGRRRETQIGRLHSGPWSWLWRHHEECQKKIGDKEGLSDTLPSHHSCQLERFELGTTLCKWLV